MSAQVISLFDYFESSRDWTQRELAEFYRVESALVQTGLRLETERGVTDEGEPWFVFCRADTGEAFIHFARVDGKYIAVGAALDQVVEGRDFAALVQEILSAQAWVMAKARNRANVYLHPSALLIAIVGAAFFHSGEAKASETADHGRTEFRRHVLPILIREIGEKAAPDLQAAETAAIVSSVLIEWSRVAPLAVSSREIAPIVAAAGASFLAPPPPLAHASADVFASVQPAIGADADPAAPPPMAARPAQVDMQSPELAPPPATVNAMLADHALADPSALAPTSEVVLVSELAAPAAPVAQVLAPIAATDAVEIIQASNVFSEVAVAAVSVNPSAGLINLVDRGEHLVASPPSTVLHPAPVSTPVTVTPPAPADSQDAGVSPPAPISTVHDLPLISPQVEAAVLQFAAEVSVLDVAVSGNEIILYDGAIFHDLPAGTQLESMTFNFADGSSISLVGTVAELHSLHFT